MVTKNTDLDQGGHGYPRTRAYLGPSLGWVDQLVKPVTLVQSPLYGVQPGDSVIMVDTNVVGPSCTIILPDVIAWVQQPQYQPATGFEKALWIKDIGGNAASSNIFVQPFTGQKIDNLAISFQIVQNRQLLRLYPIVEWNYPPGEFIGWFTG
jgi:hypothetical protein